MAKVVAEKGNENSITDAGVAGLVGMAAVDGAGYNVRINLTSINDKKFVEKLMMEVKSVTDEARKIDKGIRDLVESKL